MSPILGAWTINEDLSDLGVGPAGRGDAGGGSGRGEPAAAKKARAFFIACTAPAGNRQTSVELLSIRR